MFEVSIVGAEFHAFHGVYPEEQKIGGRFGVDVKVWMNSPEVWDDRLENTIDYSQLYKICAEVMQERKALIETVAHSITEKVFQKFPQVIKAEVAIHKYQPPIGGPCEKATFRFVWER